MKILKSIIGYALFAVVLHACGNTNEEPAMNKSKDTTTSIPGNAEEKNNRDTSDMRSATQPGGGTENPAASVRDSTAN